MGPGFKSQAPYIELRQAASDEDLFPHAYTYGNIKNGAQGLAHPSPSIAPSHIDYRYMYVLYYVYIYLSVFLYYIYYSTLG